MPFINGDNIINAIPITIPAIPTGGIISNQILIPIRQKPRIKKKTPPVDLTLLDPHLGHGSHFVSI